MTRPASRATLYHGFESTVSLALNRAELGVRQPQFTPSVDGDEVVRHGQAPFDPLTLDESTATLGDRPRDTWGDSEPASGRPPGRRPRASRTDHGHRAAQAQRPPAQTRRPDSIRVLSRRRILLDRHRAP